MASKGLNGIIVGDSKVSTVGIGVGLNYRGIKTKQKIKFQTNNLTNIRLQYQRPRRKINFRRSPSFTNIRKTPN